MPIHRPAVGRGLWSVDSPAMLLPLLAALLLLITWGAGTELSHGSSHPLPVHMDYLSSLLRPDGAICMTPDKDRVVPYFSNLSALAMLEYPRFIPAVKDYLHWYLRHLNGPDRFGLHGTVYDYTYEGDQATATMGYDSADSYAATYLTLVYRYSQVSGDWAFVRGHLDDLERVAGVLVHLQDQDGLIWAKPNYPLKYLMDNAENYRGLMDFAVILTSTDLAELGRFYSERAEMLRVAIESYLWDPIANRYHWALDGLGRAKVYRAGHWYPDAVAQLYPILFGIDEPDSARARALYADLNQQFPNWPALVKGDPYPWAVVAYIAALMGDYPRAAEAVQAMEENHLFTSGQPYWYNLEHAYYMRTCVAIRHQ